MIRGLSIDGFSEGGVLIDGASNVTIDRDNIGINPAMNGNTSTRTSVSSAMPTASTG